jgi:ABC-type transporter lipoprotein component MlaA
MKTIKFLTIIGGLMLLSATAFSQEPEKKEQSKPEVYLAHNTETTSYAEYFEVREAYHNLREFFNKQAEELQYNPDEYVEGEMEIEEWMINPDNWNTK